MRSSVSVLGSRTRAMVALAGALATAGCGGISSLRQTFFGGSGAPEAPKPIEGFIGGVAADEPRAAVTGRDVLALGGNAVDAAVALGFALTVTLPSRAGLGAGGACLAYSPDSRSAAHGNPEAVTFTSVPGSGAGDRPAAVPMLARGLFALHARYGSRPFESLIAPAEQMARFGIPVSRAFSSDLALVAGPLMADPNARAVFAENGTPLREGQKMVQPDLGATLAQIRISGVGDLYQGTLAHRLADASRLAGGEITTADLRGALPGVGGALVLPAGRDRVAFLPPPADGGLAALAAFAVLQRDPSALQAANARGLEVAARWRMTGGAAQAALNSTAPAPPFPPLPASTTWVTLDRHGMAVACAVSMNNLFGTGRIAPGTGVLLAASPRAVPTPLLAAALAWNPNLGAFRAEVAGSGQEGAPLAVAFGMHNALSTASPMPVPVPEPGRANAIACSRYLPGSERSCALATDPRGYGLAIGSQ